MNCCREFDPLKEINLTGEGFGEAAFVNVGWGKKETQFHGSEGKAAAKEVRPKMRPIHKGDDRMTRVVWRDDGERFACSYVSHEGDNMVVIDYWKCVPSYFFLFHLGEKDPCLRQRRRSPGDI